jgi:hypothetical protein
MDFNKLINDINLLFMEFHDLLWFEHVQIFLQNREYLKKCVNLTMIHSIYGEHYTNCAWANNSTMAGCSTCGCHYLTDIARDTDKLIKFYKKILYKKYSKCNVL